MIKSILINYTKAILSLFISLNVFVLSVNSVQAQLGGNCGALEVDSAIGCIPIDNTNSFAGWFFGWSIGIGGGIAFLLIIYASFIIATSQGLPDRLKSGQELLTSAVSGLVMLIFSIFILRFIGFDILQLDSL